MVFIRICSIVMSSNEQFTEVNGIFACCLYIRRKEDWVRYVEIYEEGRIMRYADIGIGSTTSFHASS